MTRRKFISSLRRLCTSPKFPKLEGKERKPLVNTLEVFKLLREKGFPANTSEQITETMAATIQKATSNLVSKQDLMTFQADHIRAAAKLRALRADILEDMAGRKTKTVCFSRRNFSKVENN